MATKTLKNVIEVLCKPPSERTNQAVASISPWLQKTAAIFADIERAYKDKQIHNEDTVPEIVNEIIRKCELVEFSSDEIIVQQGDFGDRMYIVLNGKGTIYIASPALLKQKSKSSIKGAREKTVEFNLSKSNTIQEEKEPSLATIKDGDSINQSSASIVSHDNSQPTRVSDRTKLGKECGTVEAGNCFGEVALVQKGSKRTATVVADQSCMLMVIDKQLYDTTLKSYYETEYREKEKFVEGHPLFRGWNPRLRLQLEVSLNKHIVQYGQHLVEQGDAVDGLIFVHSGEGIMTTAPSKHEGQYPERMPFKDHADVYELVFNKVKKVFEKCYLDDKGYSEFDHIHVRRREGYAAAEKRNAEKTITLCSVEPGDTVGDIELVSGLDTYIQTVECLSKTVVYRLSKSNLDRLLGITVSNKILKGSRLAEKTQKLLQEIVEHKLHNRLESLREGTDVPLFNHLLYSLNQPEKTAPLPVPELKVSKELPDRETLFYHLLQAWLQDRAELSEPTVPGGVYLRDLNREKAKEREMTNGGKKEKELPIWLQKPVGKKKHPRTVKVLRAALEQQKLEQNKHLYKQQLEEELAAHEADLNQVGLTKERLKVFFSNMDSNQALITENTMFREEPAPAPPKKEETEKKEDVEKDDKDTDEVLLERSDTFITQINVDRLSNPDKSFYQDPVGESNIRSESMENFRKLELPNDNNINAIDANENNDNEANEDPEELRDILGLETSSTYPKMKSRKKEPDTFRSLDEVRGGVIARVRESLKPKASFTERPAYRDWETSDQSLGYLEHRVQQFALSYGAEKGQVRTLPKLKRFEAPGFVPNQPRAGGKVFIRHHPCPMYAKKVQMKEHSHTRIHMLPEIENFEQMRRTRMMAHAVIAESRNKWKRRHDIS